MFRCRSVWARYISLTLLLLLNSLVVTNGSSLHLRKAYTERLFRQSLVTGLELHNSDSDALSQQLKDTGSGATERVQGISGEGKTSGNWEFETGMNRNANDASRKNRRLFRGRTDRPRPQGWRFFRGRSTMEASTTVTPETAANPSQPLYLGPPAPSTIVHNEKQDWNQDYAEPDVHPPSSN